MEFDTEAGTVGNAFDGTYFTIDDFHAEGVDPTTQIATMLLLGTGLISLAGFRRNKFKKLLSS